MVTDRPGERTGERGDEIAFILDCSPLVFIPLIPEDDAEDLDPEPEISE